MLTANVPELMKLLRGETLQKTVATLLADSDVNHVRYHLPNAKSLVIFNAAKTLHTPQTNEQMLAKGLVVVEHEFSSYLYYEVVCVPFPKFYNSFEDVPNRELPDIALNYEAEIFRKMDGTLINVWYFENEAYFSTRGRILNFEKNEFWNLVQKVIKEKNYMTLVDGTFDNLTLMLELVGPSNVILERYTEDDLVLIGATDMEDMYLQYPSFDIGGIFSDWNLPRSAERYEANSPKELIESWDNVCEGVVVNYLDRDGAVVYRVKFKQEAYLNLLKAKSFYQSTPVLELLIQHRFSNFPELKEYLEKELEGYAFLEELLHIYKTEFDNEFGLWSSLHAETNFLLGKAEGIKFYETRKERFLNAESLYGNADARLIMAVLDGKLDFWGILEKLYKRWSA